MNRKQWAERLPIIKAFVEGKPIQGFSGITNAWHDAESGGDFDFDTPSEWRLKPGQNEQSIDILFQTIHQMRDQIGELQLQVQKLETGKRDDQPDEALQAEVIRLRRFQQDVDERVRQEVQLATDVLRREYSVTNQETFKLFAQIRNSYAKSFEEDNNSPLEDLVKHTFIALGEGRKNNFKLKRLLERWLEIDNGNPNDRRDLINETREYSGL